MRGKGGRSGLQIVPRRITPAYAGKSFTRELLLIVSRDHPRVCGEKNGENGLTFHQMGSPPRMRGKVGWSAERSRPEGITPAYAGKSFLRSSSQLLNGDHPRVCGEKLLMNLVPLREQGSPPRMRGKDATRWLSNINSRITPAYAGKSLLISSSALSSRDHPRVCGEKQHEPAGQHRCLGSPPRMRGKD